MAKLQNIFEELRTIIPLFIKTSPVIHCWVTSHSLGTYCISFPIHFYAVIPFLVIKEFHK